jgi:tight adherence protein C
MTVLLLLGLVLTGVAVGLALRATALGHASRREALAQIDAYGFVAPTPVQPVSTGWREVLDPLATSLGTLALRLPGQDEAELRRLLRAAGSYRLAPATFLGYRVGIACIVPLLWLWLAIASGSFGVRSVLGICLMAGLGWTLPKFVLERRGTTRIQRIDRELPELVDLLVTTVEAGVGFAASLQLVAGRVEGPLAEELRLALQEQSMGLTIEAALEHMLDRVDSSSLRTFVQAILQGQTLGVSIGKILRDLAVEMRKRRRQMAEERAQKAPTKLLFPLVFLILPSLFIVALGGPMITLIKALGSA